MKTNSKIYKKICKLHLGGGGHDVPDELQDLNIIQPIVKEIPVTHITDTVDDEQNYNNFEQNYNNDNNNSEQIFDNNIRNNVNLPWMDVSKVALYTIPVDTVLYHGSQTINTFNVQSLKLHTDTNVIFFSPNIDIAKSYIKDCSPTNPTGFVHKFVVVKPIDKIYIISANETSNVWQEDIIEKKFCNNIDRDTGYFDLRGIGFFVKDADTYNSEFALCKPSEFLDYKGRTHCNGARMLSNNFEKF